MLRTPGLRVTPVDAALGTQAWRYAADYRLRGGDAIYAALAFEFGLALYTWDRELLERARGFVRVLEPT